MIIDIKAIPENEMRVPGLGDWYYDGDTLVIRSTLEEGEDQAFLVALHELCEAWLCKKAGITAEDVDRFDLAFEGDGEPGDDPSAVYRVQHRKAMILEHLMASFLGLDTYGEIR